MSTRSILPYLENKRSSSDWRVSYPKFPTNIGFIFANSPQMKDKGRNPEKEKYNNPNNQLVKNVKPFVFPYEEKTKLIFFVQKISKLWFEKYTDIPKMKEEMFKLSSFSNLFSFVFCLLRKQNKREDIACIWRED